MVDLPNLGPGIRDGGLGIALVRFEDLFPVFQFIGGRSLVLFSTIGLLKTYTISQYILINNFKIYL